MMIRLLWKWWRRCWGRAGWWGLSISGEFLLLSLHDTLEVSWESIGRQSIVTESDLHRGAQGSQGKTSWSAKPEVGDYKSVAGLMIGYLRDLALGRTEMRTGDREKVTIDLILGGYSYGSMVLSLMPPTSEIMKVFENAEEGTGAAEINLRAAKLADETLKVEMTQVETASGGESDIPGSRGRPTLKPSDALVFGGEETSPDVRRRSQEHHGARRSLDVARKSLDQVPKRVKEAVKRAGSHRSELDQGSGEEAILEEDDQLEAPRVAYTEVQRPGVSVRTRYLLVSPLLPPLSGFLSMSMSSMMPRKLGWSSHSSRSAQADGEPSKDTLASHPTLAIFGAEDGFTSGQRLSLWAQRVEQRSRLVRSKQSQESDSHGFDWLSIEYAGHFWREDGVKDVMRKRIEEWVSKLEGISGNA